MRFNNVFGYYIEISKANLHLAPADYERKQTLVNAERFTTPELKELEAKILEAEERMLAIERDIFNEIRSATAAEAMRIRNRRRPSRNSTSPSRWPTPPRHIASRVRASRILTKCASRPDATR